MAQSLSQKKKMYYKITDQQSAAYQEIKSKLDEWQSKREQAHKILKATVEFEWEQCLSSTSPWNLIGEYAAFKPVDDTYEPEKHWKPYSKQYPRHFEPDGRTKKGKQIKEKLSDLPGMRGFCMSLFPDMELHHTGSGTLHVCNGYNMLDDGTILMSTHRAVESLGRLLEGMVEITSVEYNSLLEAE